VTFGVSPQVLFFVWGFLGTTSRYLGQILTNLSKLPFQLPEPLVVVLLLIFLLLVVAIFFVILEIWIPAFQLLDEIV
jgi:hypothetical protein